MSRARAAGKIGQCLDTLPLPAVLFAAFFPGLASFIPEPHLFEKLKMLLNRTLNRPIDIFDLAYHGLPVILLLLKLIRIAGKGTGEK